MRPRKFGPGARPSTFRNRSRSRCRRNATTSDPPRARSRRLAFRRTRRIMGCKTLSAAPWLAARGRRRSSRSARHGYQTLGYLRPEAGSGFPTLWGTPWDVFSGKLGKCMPGEALTEIVVLPLPERPQRRVRSSGLLPQAARSGCVAPVRRKQVPAVLPRRLPDLCGQLAARRDHERARVAGRLTVGQALQDRLEEGRGLARAAHGANELSARAEFHKNYASFRSCPLSSRADRRLYQPTRAAENPGVREAGVGAGQHPLL